MNFIYFMVILTSLLIWVPWLWRYQVQPFLAKKKIKEVLRHHPDKLNAYQVYRLLTKLYSNINAKKVSQLDRKRSGIQDDAFIYGEIEFLSFIFILEKVQPQAGEIFYDLGCGSGKAVFTAALSADLAYSYGVELLPGLFALANKQMTDAHSLLKANHEDALYLPKLASIHFIQNNFLNVDISNGDIIFINATCIPYHAWEAVLEKIKSLKSGSRVIVTTKKMNDENFQLIYQGRELMSWGMNSVRIYKKV